MMAETNNNNDDLGKPQQQATCSAGQGGCCQCQQVIRELSCGRVSSQAAPIKEVLLVFLLPLVCAAAVVIWAVHSWPTLAEHPGYLALTALAVAAGALAIARVLTHKKINRAEANQTQK